MICAACDEELADTTIEVSPSYIANYYHKACSARVVKVLEVYCIQYKIYDFVDLDIVVTRFNKLNVSEMHAGQLYYDTPDGMRRWLHHASQVHAYLLGHDCICTDPGGSAIDCELHKLYAQKK